MWHTATMVALLLPGPADAAATASPGPGASSGPILLDVPYVAQRELLCGGACLAMVRRFRGERGLQASDFAADIDSEDGVTVERMGWM